MTLNTNVIRKTASEVEPQTEIEKESTILIVALCDDVDKLQKQVKSLEKYSADKTNTIKTLGDSLEFLRLEKEILTIEKEILELRLRVSQNEFYIYKIDHEGEK